MESLSERTITLRVIERAPAIRLFPTAGMAVAIAAAALCAADLLFPTTTWEPGSREVAERLREAYRAAGLMPARTPTTPELEALTRDLGQPAQRTAIRIAGRWYLPEVLWQDGFVEDTPYGHVLALRGVKGVAGRPHFAWHEAYLLRRDGTVEYGCGWSDTVIVSVWLGLVALALVVPALVALRPSTVLHREAE